MISEESAQNYSFLNQELYRFLIFQHFCAFFLWKKYFLRKIKLFSLPIYLYENPVYSPLLRPISTQEKFPRTENFPKISLLKLENFQLQNFFPTESLCRPITFYKFFFLRKIFRNLCLQFYYNFTIWEITMEQGSSLMA